MPEFIEFYKNDKYQFCIRIDDIKSLRLQRNLIIKEESIRISDEMRKANYIDSINNYSKKWKCKKGVY